MQGLPFFPPAASTMAGRVDQLFFFLLIGSALITLGILLVIVVFLVKYRRRPGNEVARAVRGTVPVEMAWTLIPLGLSMIPFSWGAWLYLDEAQPPADSLEVYVVAKQWMWKVEHPDGQSEINELHVPVGRAVKLTMTSQDVIHSFYVPEFRIKQDVLPGRYTSTWFQATRAGEYHLFCAEYCGTDHSQMIGRVIAMEPAAFEEWLRGGSALSPAGQGRKLFEQYGCISCHEANRAPNLAGVFGQPVQLTDGTTVVADENYIRESILNPSAKVAYGYQPIMPSFAGQLTDEQLIQLVAYVKSIGNQPGGVPNTPRQPPQPAPAGSRTP